MHAFSRVLECANAGHAPLWPMHCLQKLDQCVCVCAVWTSTCGLHLPWDKQMECSGWHGAKSSPSPCATIRNPRTSGFTLTPVTTFRSSTAADSPIQPTRTLPSVQRDWLSTENDHVAPTCLGNHGRAHFSGFLQRHCNRCRSTTSWTFTIVPRFEHVFESSETHNHY